MLNDLYTFWFTIISACIGFSLFTYLFTMIMCIISIILVVCFIDYITDKFKK